MSLIVKMVKVTTLLIITSLISSCSTDIAKYEETTPAMDIQEYFNGPDTHCHSICGIQSA